MKGSKGKKRRKLVTFRVSPEQKELLKTKAQEAGYKNTADYVRHLLKHSPNKPRKILNPEAFEELVDLGNEIDQIGQKINRVAFQANLLQKLNRLDKNKIEQFNGLMKEYMGLRKRLVKVLREAVSNK